ncbi:hypothetical protein CLNEO_27160 [Anaerotignum neopropionicum]|uniref:Uncharacterized protein n=1 Tax=Anaerotignum neopropionicum TaxID=36847 RepID=A0A136WC03_9FIRM|nr:hypothetical protein [Anaerotignum neopropionicum]KXL51859.1 hypothetical protein CLNEO_27160 [Anaerotignum neopropionicum]
MSILNDKEIPIGLGMALSQNLDAMQAFASLEKGARNHVIERSHHAQSKNDMQNIVNDLLK